MMDKTKLTLEEMKSLVFDDIIISKHLNKEKSFIYQQKNVDLMLMFYDRMHRLSNKMSNILNFIKAKLLGYMLENNIEELSFNTSNLVLYDKEYEDIDFDTLIKFLPNKDDYNRVVKIRKERELLINTPSVRKSLKKIV